MTIAGRFVTHHVENPVPALEAIDRFARAMVNAVPQPLRRAFVG